MSEIAAQIAQYVEDIDRIEDDLGALVIRKIKCMRALGEMEAELAQVVKAANAAADEAVFEAEMAGKDGPLGGMAKSSKGYLAGVRILEDEAKGQWSKVLEKMTSTAATPRAEEREVDELIKTLHYILRAHGAQLGGLCAILPHEEPDTDRTLLEGDCPF